MATDAAAATSTTEADAYSDTTRALDTPDDPMTFAQAATVLFDAGQLPGATRENFEDFKRCERQHAIWRDHVLKKGGAVGRPASMPGGEAVLTVRKMWAIYRAGGFKWKPNSYKRKKDELEAVEVQLRAARDTLSSVADDVTSLIEDVENMDLVDRLADILLKCNRSL